MAGAFLFLLPNGVREQGMIVVVNEKEMEIAPEQTVFDLLTTMGVSPDTVVVERNGGIVPSAAFAQTGLRDGDHLEVLRFVGGG